jgi:hypothetical protein
MDRSSVKHESVTGQPTTEPAAGSDDLVVLGQSNPATGPPLHPEGTSETERPHGRITVAGVMKLLEWQRFRCALTGRELTPETASLDHIVPVRYGGEHVLQNAQALHKDVNRAKTTMTNGEFIRMCNDVVAYATVRADGELVDEG